MLAVYAYRPGAGRPRPYGPRASLVGYNAGTGTACLLNWVKVFPLARGYPIGFAIPGTRRCLDNAFVRLPLLGCLRRHPTSLPRAGGAGSRHSRSGHGTGQRFGPLRRVEGRLPERVLLRATRLQRRQSARRCAWPPTVGWSRHPLEGNLHGDCASVYEWSYAYVVLA